ncbi:MAG: thioesterase [Armatimonadota bacterium]|nr:thioesterase [Armatimonadota bacterium]MDR7533372.1 thioesterase [Armatimonadota bacterium]MDR7536492.1 thioesterase [Armatimonadota bacterium]
MADDPNRYSLPFRVRYEECGPGGTLRAAVCLRYAQELAFAHSAALGFSLAWYEAHRRFWLVRRIALVVEAPARYGDDLIGTTQVLGMRRVLARRRTTIRRAGDGAPVASAVVDWIFTADGTAPARVPPDLVAAFPALGRAVTLLPLPAPATPEGAVWTARRFRLGDLDAMGHVNNAVYVDLLDDAVWRAGAGALLEGHPRTYDLQYHAAARADEVLRETVWEAGSGWWYRLETTAGDLRAHGRLRPDGL